MRISIWEDSGKSNIKNLVQVEVLVRSVNCKYTITLDK